MMKTKENSLYLPRVACAASTLQPIHLTLIMGSIGPGLLGSDEEYPTRGLGMLYHYLRR